ncbi:ATP-binding protein [Candidatus Williamhamiltonella defendens]|uniref:ATP-binding protein n=1 Tax=Candidatus Williamhamiltonella defendens TaxID=138072 RepID=UPI0015823BBF|nr:ATP-binding protein [Candidatus Hamiltonella defensa]
MNYSAAMTTVRQKLADLNAPPKRLKNTVYEERDALCDRHGIFKQRCRRIALYGKEIETKTECPSCLTEKLSQLQQAEAEQKKRRKHHKIKMLMDDLHLPERFAGVTLDNYEPVTLDAARCLKLCNAYATHWPERLKRGGGLVMCGKPGTGKNHLALSIAKHVINEHQSSALLTTVLRIARDFKSTWNKNAECSEAEVIKRYTQPDLLIIDEVGVQFGSEAEKMILFEVFNTRYESMKPTILISNLALNELAGFIGERVMDRMQEGGGGTLAFTWNSYRQQKSQCV